MKLADFLTSLSTDPAKLTQFRSSTAAANAMMTADGLSEQAKTAALSGDIWTTHAALAAENSPTDAFHVVAGPGQGAGGMIMRVIPEA